MILVLKNKKWMQQYKTWAASLLLVKSNYSRLHHKQLYFGHPLDHLHNAKGRQKSQEYNPWPFLSLLKDMLAGTPKS